jgi:uncharacterized RDD family membrane protein YckC
MKTFIKRLMSGFLDASLLWVVGWVLSIWLADQFHLLGRWAILVGIFVFSAYFFLFEGLIGTASPGKRIFGLRVRFEGSMAPKLVGSIVRPVACVMPLAAVVYFPSWNDVSSARVGSAIFLFFVSVFVAQLVFFFINRGETLHDWLSVSHVSGPNTTDGIRPKKVKAWHGLLAIGFIFIFLLAYSRVGSKEALASGCERYDLLKARSSLLSAGSLKDVRIACINPYLKSIASISVEASVLSMNYLTDQTMDGLIARILNEGGNLFAGDELLVRLRYGFDIGIYRSEKSMSRRIGKAE